MFFQGEAKNKSLTKKNEMSKDLVKNNHIIKPFIVSAVIFIFVGSLIGSTWLAFILKVNIIVVSELFRTFGIILFVIKIVDTLKVKPKLFRTADYFIGFSYMSLLI